MKVDEAIKILDRDKRSYLFDPVTDTEFEPEDLTGYARKAYCAYEMVIKALEDKQETIRKLEERTAFLKDCRKYGNRTPEQMDRSYGTMTMYEVAELVKDLVDIVKESGMNETD